MSDAHPTLTQILRQKNLNLSSNPKGTDKGDYKTYIAGFYEGEFSKRRNLPSRILEVGVRSGASLSLWASYFTKAEICGLDIEPAESTNGPLKEYINYPNVSFICKNAYDPDFAKSVEGVFDILIDDGPHSLESQKQFISLYIGKLARNGVLIIEDIQDSVFACYGLMKELPYGYEFKIHDFRSKSGGYDDMLFVVRHSSNYSLQMIQRLNLTVHYWYTQLRRKLGKLKSNALKPRS